MRCEILRLKFTKFDFVWALPEMGLRGLLLRAGREGRRDRGNGHAVNGHMGNGHVGIGGKACVDHTLAYHG